MQTIQHYRRRVNERLLRFKECLVRIRNLIIRHRFAFLDLTASVSKRAKIYGSKSISIEPYVKIFPHAILQCSSCNNYQEVDGTIVVGEGTVIQPYAYLHTDGGNIKVGKHCSVNSFCMLLGQGGLTIGDNVRIANHTSIIPSNHIFDRIDVPIHGQGSSKRGVHIENDVWIGAGVRILDGVKVSTGCVIGAGSVVTKSTEPFGVYVGVPAKRIKNRLKG